MISVLSSLQSLFSSEEDFSKCVAWASEQEYPIHMKFPVALSQNKATAIKEEWDSLKNEEKKSIFPLRSSTPLTLGAIHAYLQELLRLHPDAATLEFKHAEFGMMQSSREITYSKEEECLCIS